MFVSHAFAPPFPARIHGLTTACDQNKEKENSNANATTCTSIVHIFMHTYLSFELLSRIRFGTPPAHRWFTLRILVIFVAISAGGRARFFFCTHMLRLAFPRSMCDRENHLISTLALPGLASSYWTLVTNLTSSSTGGAVDMIQVEQPLASSRCCRSLLLSAVRFPITAALSSAVDSRGTICRGAGWSVRRYQILGGCVYIQPPGEVGARWGGGRRGAGKGRCGGVFRCMPF